jgi:hypothetical protein
MKTFKKYINYIYLAGIILLFYFISRYVFGTNKTIEGFEPFDGIFNFWMGIFNFWYNVFEYGIMVWKWNMYYQDPFSYHSQILVNATSPPPNPADDNKVPTWVKIFFPTPASSNN